MTVGLLSSSVPAAAKVVDWSQLLQVVEASLLAGIGTAAAFAFVIYGSTRAAEHRRNAQPAAAGAHIALAIVALLVVAAAIVFGVATMLQK
ncbi:MAG: hypothetical protein JWQ48_871 [Conexibacter sp.]|nr:hypothetical protein [Conexibacter sp.]